MYLNGIGADQSTDRARAYFNQAIASGNKAGYVGLGRSYMNDLSQENAAANAFSNIQTASEANIPDGIYYMGLLYEKESNYTEF